MMNFNLVLPQTVSDLLGRLQAAGYAAYVVGGCVRDFIMGTDSNDYPGCCAVNTDGERFLHADVLVY